MKNSNQQLNRQTNISTCWRDFYTIKLVFPTEDDDVIVGTTTCFRFFFFSGNLNFFKWPIYYEFSQNIYQNIYVQLKLVEINFSLREIKHWLLSSHVLGNFETDFFGNILKQLNNFQRYVNMWNRFIRKWWNVFEITPIGV